MSILISLLVSYPSELITKFLFDLVEFDGIGCTTVEYNLHSSRTRNTILCHVVPKKQRYDFLSANQLPFRIQCPIYLVKSVPVVARIRKVPPVGFISTSVVKRKRIWWFSLVYCGKGLGRFPDNEVTKRLVSNVGPPVYTSNTSLSASVLKASNYKNNVQITIFMF